LRLLYHIWLISQQSHNDSPIDRMISERSQLLSLTEIEFEWRDIGSIESLRQYCSGNRLDCKIDPMHINQFNTQNKDFELNYFNGGIQIIKK
jgi:mannose-1-phosphate guanylyltransferase